MWDEDILMKYKAYVEKKEDGTNKLNRKARKNERKLVFHYNKKLHSKRIKRQNRTLVLVKGEE
jgi:hypothetical protein